ncbi:hypothetical protein L1O59_005240 [Salmonella enterica]|uniref:hypothetical protein n=1 Tax=Salmonella enterica TaxID=28901 RepID=UPI0012D64DA1|nr:hypothetical protein [Salmonella enterica]EBQ9004957.1 hypothetical protein [Salmonella enterica subsp. enterica serovar Blockley]ECD6161878.1 hypothetical protein [Salmonella enterica subsp. enterica]ECU7994972.1 hypothetical protein [Salmonella enterica subsp. enterica serovar Toucra]EAW3045844.1 hypothetical protein [Salmonella enterica]
MTRIIEIYSRLNALDEFLALMLKQPDIYRSQVTLEQVAELVEYVDNVHSVLWRQLERRTLSDFDTCYILPAVSEIWLQVKHGLTVNSLPAHELAGCIMELISLVSFYLYVIIEGNDDKNRVLH